jgi:uncharacterized protein (DUF342 family)
LHGGKNVTLSADGVQLVATADGHAQQLPDGGVDVEPTYTIKGDVGPMTGNIDFVGSLIITGDVKSEFTVHAGNNVDVRGSVGDSEISADGDVRVAQGFVGTGKGKIVAGKTARVKHVHYQTVIGHTIVVEHECIGATLQAESKISSNRAVFIGGHLSAGDEVEVYDLGNGEETNVTVQVGARPRLLERLGEIERRAAQVEKQLTEVKAGMYKLVRIQLDAGTLTPEQEDLMNRLKKVQEDLPKELAAIAAEQVKLKGLMEQSMAGKIIARGTVAANAHLDINGVRKFVSSPMREVMFVEKSGRIEQLPA